MGNRRLVLLASLVGLFYTLLPEGSASAQICDRAGYTREANCPNEARDATGCCPAPRVVTPRTPRAALPPAEEACPLTQVRTASGRCCWPGQRGTASGCAGRPRSCPLGWEPSASGCLPAGTRSRSMVLVPPPTEGSAAFVIDRTPVTVQAYRQCVEAGTCAWREPEHLCNGASHRTHPMNCVSSEAAGVYCAWAGLRLPTAAEWARAAGAADGRRYPWGDDLPDDRRAHWGQVCARPPCTAPVGRRPTGASPYGALEMAGNVWEWTAEGHARGGDWTGSELEMRVEAARRGEVGAHLGFRCIGRDLAWTYVETLGESDPPVAESRLEVPFRDLARAHHHLGEGQAAAAAERFGAAIAALEALGHSRAFVFHYHAAAAHERAGDRDAAERHVAAYFEAGGTDPPPFDAPPLGLGLRRVGFERALSVWERDQPHWAQRDALRATLRLGSTAPANVEASLWDWLDVVQRVLRDRRPAEAEARYVALERRWREAGVPPWAARAHLAAALEHAGEAERAAVQYAVYLSSGGEYPRTAMEGAIGEDVVAQAERLRRQWEARLSEGRQALQARELAQARSAFEESPASVDGHPSQTTALTWLALVHEREGDLRAARSRLMQAIAYSPSDPEVGRVARMTLWRIDQRVGVGDRQVCAVRRGNTLVCWDRGAGRGADTARLPRVTGVALGSAHGCVLHGSRGVSCWGDNHFGQTGPPNSAAPSWGNANRIALSGAVGLSAGASHTCALREDGQVYCWGSNEVGQLGVANSASAWPPTPVAGVTRASAIAAGGQHTCALHWDGTVTCWGGHHQRPARIAHVHDAVALTASAGHTCALRVDGRSHCWGIPSHPINAESPVPGLSRVVHLAAGDHHACALRADGRVLCWGENAYGQLGFGDRLSRETPESVPGMLDAVALAAGAQQTCAELRDGRVECWGEAGFVDGHPGSRSARVMELPPEDR